jgi:hypothetical protein
MLRTAFIWLLASTVLTVAHSDCFTPAHQLTGIGVARSEITPELLNERVKLMMDSQTFSILRDPRAVQGAQRVESPQLSKAFAAAERQSGLPSSLIKAIAYLESFGDPTAQSPTGPKGIMQVSGATAQAMGLRMIYTTKYRTVSEKKAAKNKRGKTVYKTVKQKTAYQILLRDERLLPDKAIPAAATYLARLQQNLGGLDWAIFAYHCGAGCVGNMQAMTERAQGMRKPITVAQMFFGASPVYNRELYEEIHRQMERDYSPTYWFRVMRAQQLLTLYREDPSTFQELASYYRYEPDPSQRAQHRLAVWLKQSDMLYQSCDDIKRDQGKRLARIFDNPEFYGFRLNMDTIGAFDIANREYYLQATPAAIGTLTYIAFETHRLFDAMKPRGEKFEPLEVTSLVRPMDSMGAASRSTGTGPTESLAHCSGQVFDVQYDRLPPGEREALQFVLDDMGWEGYLGFVEEAPNSGSMHIGCSPSSREFFTDVYLEALGAKKQG